jgi:tumor protein p53-inducible protein 3
MRAVLIREPGAEDVLALGDVPSPALGPAEIRIRVRATAVNRADLLQRQGLYPPPRGASDILGLECAGEIIEVGSDVPAYRVGERVMALLAGGGYAEEAVVHHGSVIPVPDDMTDEEAGAFPEVFLTAFSNLYMPHLGAIAPGERALVHGGGGGVGTAAIALLRCSHNPCFVTVGSEDKGRRCVELGAGAAINYHAEDFSARARELSDNHGVDVILDHIGAKYLQANLAALAPGGRLIEIGLMGGARGEINLADLLLRRLAVIGSTLRSRPLTEKTAIVTSFQKRFMGALIKGHLRPVIDTTFPLAAAADAHRLMQSSRHFGKIVLRVE